MIEGLLAEYLNNYLAKYIQNLDSENVTVGILSGNVELTDLQLKPEALFQLGLPIEVKAGYVGRISITWSWSGLFSGTTEPAIALVEDVYIVAAPLTDRKYDPQRERALRNAIKREKLDELEKSSFQDEDEKTEEKGGWFSFDFAHKFVATLVNNLEVCVERIHIRYEDRISNPEHPFACGLILEKLKASTTNSQWKPTQVDAQATMIHKLVELKSLGAYWNWNIPDQGMLRNKLHTTAWRNLLKHSIDSHRIMEDNLDFIMRPVSANIKAVLNKKDNTTIPKVLADFVFQEIDILISRQQYLNMLSLADSFKMMTVNQRYRKYSPGVPLLGNAARWWKYAYNAVVHEFIRPYSWQRIKAHRQKYRRYKDLYKQRLHNPESTNLDQQLIDLEYDLDLPNILMAREQAKLEFSKEAPSHAERRRQGKSWWSWMWSSSESEDEEIVITKPKSQPGWLSQLTEEEREKIYRSIGYDENRNMEQSPQYVAHQLNIHLGSCSLTLVNYSNEILKVSVSKVELGFDNRPDSGGFRGRARTEAFIVEGVSIEHELVPIITSEIGVYTPSQVSQVFICEFEINPVHVDADFALRLNVQPVEIVYDEHSMTEVIAFFQVPYVTQDDVYEVAQDGWNKLAKFSTAGLKYAIEQHKTVHLSVNMRSPYIVIPEYGTLHRGGNVLVVDFGKLKVESELRVKNISLENATLSEIEARLYDQYNITVSDVKALIADSAKHKTLHEKHKLMATTGDDWHTAQTQPDTPYHILPSVGLELKFFNSVKPEYKLLPQQKVLAELPTLKLNISDEKLMMLMDFFKNVPFPHSNSMMGFDDSVDGPIVPVAPMLDEREVQHEPDWDELLHMKQAVLKNSAPRRKKHRDMVDASRLSTYSTGSEQYITASDHSDEDPEEWARGLDMPAVDDHTSPSNYIEVLLRFRLGEVVVHISKSADKIDTPYLMLRVDKMCSDVAKTKYGYTAQASLGGVQLVDKIHLGQSGEYLELLSSTAGSDLISMLYRQISPDCPDFELVYSSVEQGIVIKLSRLDLVFDRAATLYLNSFVQSLMITSYLGPSRELAKSTSTILSAVTAPDPDSLSMAQKWFYDMAENAAKQSICPRHTKLHAFAKIKDIHVKFCNHEMDFADLAIKGLESSYKIKGLQTVIQAQLTDLSVQDLSGDAIYQQILSIEDNRLFDLKLVQYGKASHKHGISKLPSLDASLTLRIGQVQAVYLNKFNSQMMNFLDPFMNPETYQFYTVEAQRAVQTRLQDIQEQGTRISLNVDIKAPVVLLPQNSTSCELLFLKLGDMCFRNDFQDLELGGHRGTQQWDHIYMHLDSLQVHRAFLSDNGNLEQGRKLVEPISLKLDIKRALPPVHSDLNWEISGKLKHIQVEMTQSDYRVVIATLQQNFSEVSDKPDRIE